jgi:hypothetical protein
MSRHDGEHLALEAGMTLQEALAVYVALMNKPKHTPHEVGVMADAIRLIHAEAKIVIDGYRSRT